MKKILLSPDPVEGGDSATHNPAPGEQTSDTAETAPRTGTPPAATPRAAAPPAAETVLNGDRTEREIELERKNAELLTEKRIVETRNAELADENFRLKQPPTDPKPKSGRRWDPFRIKK